MSGKQLLVSCFKPRHKINIQYPAVSLLTPPMQLFLPPVHDAANRFEPVPLVADTAVTVHTLRNGYYDTAFFTLAPAMAADGAFEFVKSGGLDFDRLMADLIDVALYHGDTELQVVTYRRPNTNIFVDEDFEEPAMLLQCKTRIQAKSGAPVLVSESYNVNLEEFMSADLVADWYASIMHLLARRSDHAVRHVNYWLGRYDRSSDNPPWKSRRQLDLGLALNGMLMTPSTFDSDEEDCTVCGDALTFEGDGRAVNLTCDHMVGLDCLTSWCQSTGVDKASCPLCRHPVFDNSEIVQDIKHGLTAGVYIPDTRYGDWENFERSCADLDYRLAENAKEIKLGVDPEQISGAFALMLDGARLEPIASTPYHLQPAFFPEMALIKWSFEKSINAFKGRTLTLPAMFKLIMLNAYGRSLAMDYATNNELSLFLKPVERKQIAKNPLALKHHVRPGLNDFMARIVNRVVMFQHLRRCGCTKGWHMHGGRQYYNRGFKLTGSRRCDCVSSQHKHGARGLPSFV